MVFSYQVFGSPDDVGLALSGEIDLSVRDELRSVVDTVIAAAPGVTNLDLHDLTFLDCSGIGVFVRAYNGAQRHGHTLTISRPHGIVRRVLELTGVLALLTPGDETGGPQPAATPAAQPSDRHAPYRPDRSAAVAVPRRAANPETALTER
ncbi:STAS domain-containing protein [Dactylosporangium cerinum]|uniref:Anti-sigma factor antagonist n=1 Tax=Dactylosporangium cerinum TaxID=1434730 RepID=A0ABV9VXT8_9ACTN